MIAVCVSMCKLERRLVSFQKKQKKRLETKTKKDYKKNPFMDQSLINWSIWLNEWLIDWLIDRSIWVFVSVLFFFKFCFLFEIGPSIEQYNDESIFNDDDDELIHCHGQHKKQNSENLPLSSSSWTINNQKSSSNIYLSFFSTKRKKTTKIIS